MGGEAVDDLLEVLDVAHVGEHDVAVVAGDAAALDDLGRVLRTRATTLSWPGAGRVRMTALSEKPSARGSMRAW